MGLLRRPWRRVKRKDYEEETAFVLAKRNYKVHANIGHGLSSLHRYTAVLDTGAGSSFIRKSELSPGLLKHLRSTDTKVMVRDANNRPLSISGKVNLTVQIGTRASVVSFHVVDNLAAPVIIGCDFCDRHIEAIRPRRRCV